MFPVHAFCVESHGSSVLNIPLTRYFGAATCWCLCHAAAIHFPALWFALLLWRARRLVWLAYADLSSAARHRRDNDPTPTTTTISPCHHHHCHYHGRPPSCDHYTRIPGPDGHDPPGDGVLALQGPGGRRRVARALVHHPDAGLVLPPGNKQANAHNCINGTARARLLPHPARAPQHPRLARNRQTNPSWSHGPKSPNHYHTPKPTNH